MSLFDGLADLLKKVTAGNAPPDEVHAAYDQVAGAVPDGALADGLSHAFRSDETPPFEQMVSGLFDKSTPEQKAEFVNHLIGVLGPEKFAQALGAAGLQQAEHISSETMQVLAQQAVVKDPSLVDKAASFYAKHPTLVRTIGVTALALLMRRVSAPRR